MEKFLDPIMMSRCIDDPKRVQRHDPVPILRVSTHAPMNRNDSSLETIGTYQRDSDTPLIDAPTPRRVTWGPRVMDKKDCSVYEDYPPDMKGLFSKLDKGAKRLGRRLEGLGMKCTGKYTPCTTICGREAMSIDVKEENDIIDRDDWMDHPIENNCANRDVIFWEAPDAIGKKFTFNEHPDGKRNEEENPSSSMRLKKFMDILSPSSRDDTRVTSPRVDMYSSSMRKHHLSSPRRIYPAFAVQNRMESPSLLKKSQARHAALSTPTFPPTATQPGQKLIRGQRHSGHHIIKPAMKTKALIDNDQCMNKNEFRRRIISGLKKPIEFMSIGIKSNLNNSSYPKRILVITSACPSKRSK
jgi:hypothetical protein